jgi:nucleoside-diphosphate-sugar epimerase
MKKALVAGALGVSGRALVNHLVSLQDWEVVGLSRRSPEFQSPAHYIAIDLLNRSDVDACVSNLGDLTHIFYAALQPGSNFFDEIPPNLAMLQHIVEAVERTSRSFRKIVLIEGAKYYGAHFGPYKTPAREDDPRQMPPNFYYDQEDFLRERQCGNATILATHQRFHRGAKMRSSSSSTRIRTYDPRVNKGDEASI